MMGDDANRKENSERSISRLIGEQARALPEKSHGWFREWFRKVWKVRGGGLYACGFAISFVVFEVTSLGDDLAEIGNLFNGQAFDWVIQIVIDSFKNTLKAFMWPVYVVQLAPPWGAIGLGFAFVFFTKFLKPPISRWLFPDGTGDQEPDK